ncbi:MAG: hypothetical protein RQ801_03525 [Spirochaetaceae bacterium]|nr:hypothetical protein [Spirochaetaceae bacterium]MDT8297348.1 hypothetical protein [Spirochaetaceae bacterium]
MRLSILILAAAASIIAVPLHGQQLPPSDPLVPEDYNQEEFSDWMKDLRRYEIVTIGSFPITFFAASLLYDFSFYAANDFDPAYTMGSQRDKDDIAVIISTAAAASLLIATVDIFIHIGRRGRLDRDSDE